MQIAATFAVRRCQIYLQTHRVLTKTLDSVDPYNLSNVDNKVSKVKNKGQSPNIYIFIIVIYSTFVKHTTFVQYVHKKFIMCVPYVILMYLI